MVQQPNPKDPNLQRCSAEIEKVEESLTALEEQIAKAEIADVKKTRASGPWQDEVAELRKVKKHLQRRELQLRKQEQLLPEETRILMRQACA